MTDYVRTVVYAEGWLSVCHVYFRPNADIPLCAVLLADAAVSLMPPEIWGPSAKASKDLSLRDRCLVSAHEAASRHDH